MFRPTEKLNTIIKVLDHHTGTERYVTVIGGLPFYKSSGRNSGEENTWLPYAGHLETPLYGHPVGYFLKPGYILNNNTINKFFPTELVSYLLEYRKIKFDILSRFGNFEAMCLSMIIGGGFWKNAGLPLKVFILENYHSDIEKLYKCFDRELVELQKTADNSYEVDVYRLDKPETINVWLKDHGSKAEKNDTGWLNINFEFSELQILQVKSSKLK